MTVLHKIFIAVLLLFFFFISPSTAEIKSINIRSDNRPMILFEKFGFTHTGFISVAVSNVSVISDTESTPDPSRLGFFLLSEKLLIKVLHEVQQNPNFCVVDSRYISLLFTFRDLSVTSPYSFRKTYPVTYPSEYSLFFANCNFESSVTMHVRTELYNNVNWTTKNYLSDGLTQLPFLYFIFSLIYMCFLRFWMSMCFKNQRFFHRIHVLMSALLVTKAISLICVTMDKHHVQVTGTHNVWNVLFYTFRFVNVVILFVVIVLIGAGWPYLKPLLLKKEKAVLMSVIPLQILANLAYMMLGETGPYFEDWAIWNQVFSLVDFICCCAVIFPIMWSITSLFAKTDVKCGISLRLFSVFGVVVIGYLFSLRVGVFSVKIIAGYKYQWVCNAVDEIASLVLYLVMFYMFRPVEEDKYSAVVVDDNKGVYEEASDMAKG
ncbi:hypothetical protein QVD17_00694 [Tagetes erecta]|uniref:Uncharacterized protein n=1 Tax=Tagetes erecta TaxID=13708 RepID=A0AAD8L3N5_TARER|nr:hypothetical protein QVD17_00694 [Tagetes erecta]